MAIDRASRWGVPRIYHDMTDTSSIDFLRRLNSGRINELLKQTRFDSQADLETTLHNYLKLYNYHIPQRAIGSKTPIQALKEWQQRKPDLFAKRVYEQAGLDTYHQIEPIGGLAAMAQAIFLSRDQNRR